MMEFTKEELVLLVALTGTSTDAKKSKKVKKALFLKEEDVNSTLKQLDINRNYDLGFSLYERLLNEYNKLR